MSARVSGSGPIQKPMRRCWPGLIPARLTRDGGFALGDVLLAIDGQVVDSPDDMTRALETKTPGDRVVLRVRRAGKTIEVRVTLDVAR